MILTILYQMKSLICLTILNENITRYTHFSLASDRLIMAQSLQHDLIMMTEDKLILAYPKIQFL